MSSTATTLSTPSRGVQIARWSLQAIVAAAFIAAGVAKLAGAQPMVGIFEQIGVGQWFRYVTGIVEIIGAVLLLWPGRAAFGAVLLSCTMLGALFTHFAVIGGTWEPAAVLLMLNLVLLWLNRAQLGLLGRAPAP